MGMFGSADPEQRQENDFREMIELLQKISEQLDVLIQKP